MPKFVGAAKQDAAKKALQQRPALVLFFMTGCQHCEKNKPAWEDAKAKAPAGTKIVEVDMEATPPEERVEGFPTMKYKPVVGDEARISGEKESGAEILAELGVKKGGSKRRRRTHRSRHRKLLRRTLRNYVAL